MQRRRNASSRCWWVSEVPSWLQAMHIKFSSAQLTWKQPDYHQPFLDIARLLRRTFAIGTVSVCRRAARRFACMRLVRRASVRGKLRRTVKVDHRNKTANYTMGNCSTRHPSGCLFFSNKVAHDSTSPPSDVSIRSRQPTPYGSVTGQVDASSDKSSEIRQAFLDGTLNLDSRCPLDTRQLYTLAKTWKVINRNLSVTAINIFIRQVSTLRVHVHCVRKKVNP